jgi:hypothetical protein
MKKILLALLVMFGLQIQAQVASFSCDSMEITLVSSTSTEFILGTNISSLNITQPVTYTWSYYEHIMVVPVTSTFIPGNNGANCTPCITDTLTLLNQTAIYSVILAVRDSGFLFNNQCGLVDTVSYNTITNEWELNSGSGNPTTITEIEINNVDDDRLYDLLGREFYNYNSIPPNTIYIKNRKKYLKTR